MKIIAFKNGHKIKVEDDIAETITNNMSSTNKTLEASRAVNMFVNLLTSEKVMICSINISEIVYIINIDQVL